MIRLVFRSAFLELLLVAISQNGPMFAWTPATGRFAYENGGGGPVCPVHEASKSLIPPPTLPGRDSLRGLRWCVAIRFAER